MNLSNQTVLTLLSTIKSRLAIDPDNTEFDQLLTSAIRAASTRFDKETNRTLSRTEDFHQEFDADETEILAECYPVESVNNFEIKTSEDDGWQEQQDVRYLIRKSCIISLSSPLATRPSALNPQPVLARVTYTGGYVPPGSDPDDGQTPLPDDLEQAAVEQVAAWFQHRDQLGLRTSWPKGGIYEQFLQSDLLLEVRAVLKRYERWDL